jgi:hypothetical protein
MPLQASHASSKPCGLCSVVIQCMATCALARLHVHTCLHVRRFALWPAVPVDRYDTPQGPQEVLARNVVLTTPAWVLADIIRKHSVSGGGGRCWCSWYLSVQGHRFSS